MSRALPIPRRTLLAGIACAAFAVPAAAVQWDVSSGDFHTHLISTDGGFQLHLHEKATHRVVDTRKGKVAATLLTSGKPQPVPLGFVQVGVLSGARPLVGDWTLLVRLDVPGMKPAQIRYSSKMKPGPQDAAPATGAPARGGDPVPAGHDHAGHDHAAKK